MARDILSILADMKPPKKSKFEEEEEDLARMKASGPSPLFLPRTVKQRREAEDYAGPLDMPSKPPLTLFGGDPNVGGMKPPPGKPREGSMRVHSSKRKELGEMIARVSGTKQGTRIPGLGFVPDPDPDAETASMGPPPPTRSQDPFSMAARSMNPIGITGRQLAGATVAGAAAPLLGAAGVAGLPMALGSGAISGIGANAAMGGGGSPGEVIPSAMMGAGMGLIPGALGAGRDLLRRGAVGPGEALSSRVAAPGPAASPSPQALPQGPRATILSSEPLSGSSPALGWQSSPGRNPLGVGGPSKPMALNPPPPAPGGSPPQLGAGFRSEGFMPDALTSPLRPRPPVSPGFMPDEATQGMAFRPLQAPRIPEIPGEPLPFRARIGGGTQTTPARPPPPPMSGTPPMPVRAAMPRGGAPAPQGLDPGIGDAAISEIRAGGGLPRPAPSHPFFQSMPEPSLPDTFIRPAPAAPLNTGSPLAGPMSPPPGLPGGVAPNAGQGSPSLFARADSGDPRALALATALGLPLAGAAGYGLGRGAGALFSSPSAAPLQSTPPFASPRPDLTRLQPIGEEPAPRPKKKKKKPKS